MESQPQNAELGRLYRPGPLQGADWCPRISIAIYAGRALANSVLGQLYLSQGWVENSVFRRGSGVI